MAVLFLISGLLLLFPAVCRRYRREEVRNIRRKPLIRLLLPMGLWISDRLAGRLPFVRRYRQEGEPLLLPEKEERIRRAELYIGLWACLLAGTLSGLALGAEKPAEAVRSLLRPEFGREETVDLKVSGLSEEGEEIRILVSGRVPSSEELPELFRETFESMKPVWLGENSSDRQVRTALDLSGSCGNGISCDFRSSNVDVLTDRGNIAAEEIGEEGIPVTLTVTLSFGRTSESFPWELLICRAEEEQLTEMEQLERLIEERNQSTLEEKELELPESISGRELTYEENGLSPFLPPALALLLTLILPLLLREKRKEALAEREEQLKKTLPALLSKLRALLDAGLSIRGAWFRIAEDYRKTGARIYAYEEMYHTMLEIRSGRPEREAYPEFGRRCGLHSYVKLGNLLAKSLRQGISGLSEELREETLRALQERKARALRAGEAASARLLLPMTLMLGVVIAILIIPAFMAF